MTNPSTAREIKAWMGRLDVRQAELARRLTESDQWLSKRLRGETPIDLNELHRIAEALGVLVKDLLPERAKTRSQSGSHIDATTRYRPLTETTPPPAQTIQARRTAQPKRRPHAATSPGRGTPDASTRRPGIVKPLVRA